MRHIDITALGARIVVGVGHDVDDASEDHLRRLWRDAHAPEAADVPMEAADAPMEAAVWVGEPPAGVPDHIPRIAMGDLDRVASGLSSMVTLAAILRRGGDGLLLHACAAADSDGRVLVFAGPSGAGKSTLVSALCDRFDYVSDEAVLIGPSGCVSPYRKPLSLIDPALPRHVKRQLAASDLGLRIGLDELTLAAVVLLDRRPDAQRPSELRRLDPIDAAAGLMPHVNLAAGNPRTLLKIAGVMELTGGIFRLSYVEASEVVGAAVELFARAGREPGAVAQLSGPAGDHGLSAPTTVTRAPSAVSLSSSGRTLVHTEAGLHELSPFGASLWTMLADGPLALRELAAALESEYGSPAGVSSENALVSVLETLCANGIVRFTAADAPLPAV